MITNKSILITNKLALIITEDFLVAKNFYFNNNDNNNNSVNKSVMVYDSKPKKILLYSYTQLNCQ